jgi:uncharacterized protein with GYD domain
VPARSFVREGNHAYVHFNAELDRPGHPQRQGFPEASARRKGSGQAAGVEIKQVFLTNGEFDLLAILEAPNGDDIAKLVLALGAQGNLRSRTVRGWPEAEYIKLVSELP